MVTGQNGRAIVRGFAVSHGHELHDLAGFRVAHGKELLVLFHRGLQNLGRQFKELIVDIAHQDHGPFDQPRNLGQQAAILNDLKPLGKGHVGGVMPDGFGAFGRVQNDRRAFQLGLVILKRGDGEGIRAP